MRSLVLFIITILTTQLYSKATELSPWHYQIRPLSDTVIAFKSWDTANGFVPKESVKIPEDIADGTKMILCKSSFNWSNPENATLHISPTDHPCKIFINNEEIYQFSTVQRHVEM